MANKSRQGSAYMFVLVIMMVLFLMLALIMNVTTVARNISGRYVYFAGLYNLGLMGNEYAFLFLKNATIDNLEHIKEQVHKRLKEDITQGLVFQDEGFWIEGGRFETLLINETYDFLKNFVDDTLIGRQFAFSVNVPTGRYEINTHIMPMDFNLIFDIESNAHKILSASNYTSTTTEVRGIIELPSNISYTAQIIPLSYNWRAEPVFEGATYSNKALNTIALDSLMSATFSYENSLYIAYLNEINFYAFTNPAVIIYVGTEVLQIDPTGFQGIIISQSDIEVVGDMQGLIISAGNIIAGYYFNPNPDSSLLFSVNLEEAYRRSLFDLLKLTNFTDSTDIEQLLGDLTIQDFELHVEFAEEFYPILTRVQHVAN